MKANAKTLRASAEPYHQTALTPLVKLSQQERRALSLVWSENEDESLPRRAHDSEIEHCAVLGYN
ncbi:hypothetical protein [Alishewanella tabrizica]|uniref:Uncharacterized protein n=1 Tax=Alishewanella tabrizica TaxID=671278 RepID=A0ABQ2WC91_9ALTE|nr:hypothetical protein [Alishewanella tabrizica]GGW48994.1 hypothetical protein GCM10008111_00880 [Alishewanella tabrizica]